MLTSTSIVIITKNAANTLKETLESVNEFEEVIIYDNGSEDKTLDIAKSFSNVKLYTGPFMGFGPTKNHAVSLASNNWIFSLDADECLNHKTIKFLNKIDLDNESNVGQIRRDNYFMRKELRVAGWGRDYLIRLFNRKNYCFSDRQVHEKVEIDNKANIIELAGSIKHNAIIKLSQTLDKANMYSELYAEQHKNKIKSPLSILLRAKFTFLKIYFVQLGFTAGWRGFALAYANSIGVFYKYMKIYSENMKKLSK